MSLGPVRFGYKADLCGNIEQALKGMQGYGAMAMELIQNADDARAHTIQFDARSDVLVVSNDAEFSSCGLTTETCPWDRTGGPDGKFRPCNFHAISLMGGRSKVRIADQIGRFGIGFVSVYQITDSPVICSAGTKLLLNPLTGEALPDPIDFWTGTELRLPWAFEQSDIRDALNASPTPRDVASRVVKEVSSVLRSSLLFLRHIQHVEVRESGIVRMTVDIERNDSGIALTFGPEPQVERWLVLSRKADDIMAERDLFENYDALGKLDRSTTVSIAIQVDGDPRNGLLYAYLPTQQSTEMPLHINADFFPHASRQHIVLRGEGHERYWNEALLAAAAALIGENLTLLRDKLGYARLWQLGESAFNIRDSGVFAEFWNRFGAAARTSHSVMTTANIWSLPTEVHMGLEVNSEEEQSALTSIGLSLLHPNLRRNWTALSSVGVRELRLNTLVTALESLEGAGISAENALLGSLWSAISKQLAVASSAKGLESLIDRLKAATFLIDIDGNAVSPNDVWRMPESIPDTLVRRFVPECPIIHPNVLKNTLVAKLIDEYTIDDFACHLAETIPNCSAAEKVLGSTGAAVGVLYELLTSFTVVAETTKAGQILSATPFLRTLDGFVSPMRGQLPGGFEDPTGYFEFLDTSCFPPHMRQFAVSILGVSVVNFHEYIDDHLEAILDRGPTREQYQRLLEQIVEHRHELEDEGSLELLAKRAFVKTRAGSFVLPSDCYLWSAEMESLLGSDGIKYADEAWMPSGRSGRRFRDLLESRLGLPTTVTVRHIVERLNEIVEYHTPAEVARAATPIFRHIVTQYSKYSQQDLAELSKLQTLKFVPAIVEDERNISMLYLPGEVYRAGRAPGFASQVPIIDITPLRQPTANASAILDLLGVPEEPETRVIVNHLQHLIETGTAPSDLTYTLLNERVERADDLSAIDELKDLAFIYATDLKRFLRSDQVFWRQPRFGDYWHAASSRMAQREPLFSRLGVRNEPGPSNYAALMVEIAGKTDIIETDVVIHSQCLGHICEALEASDPEAEDAINEISGERSLLNLDDEAVWPEDSAWIDSDQLAAPFGSALNYLLVQPPSVNWGAAARLFRQLGVRPLSEIARLRLAMEPDHTPAEEATNRLHDRAGLLLWLAPNLGSRHALRRIVSRAEIRLSTNLNIRAEINEFDPPVQSPISNAPAFYEREASVVHIKGSKLRQNEWVVAFRSIFSEIERFCPLADVKPLVMTAALIMLTDTLEEAEEALRSSDFRPPQDEPDDIPPGTQLGDLPKEEIGSDQGISDDGAGQETGEAKGSEDKTCNDLVDGERTAKPVDHFGTDPRARSTGKPRSSTREQINAGKAKTLQHGGLEDPYKSKSGTREFGDEESAGGEVASLQGRKGEAEDKKDPTKSTGSRGYREKRKSRTSRMLAYVARAGDRGQDDSGQGRADSVNSSLIDISAMRAALKYEERRGWAPEEQPHNNPGYDIISIAPDGRRRLIEVKGLEGDWTERGIKLTHVQYRMAEQHPDEYWIYVIERALDLNQQSVNAISNPYQKVEEYWFDHNWRSASEETVSSRELNVRVGARVRHTLWQTGTVVKVEKRGIGLMITVDFGKLEGLKYIPFNSMLQIID